MAVLNAGNMMGIASKSELDKDKKEQTDEEAEQKRANLPLQFAFVMNSIFFAYLKTRQTASGSNTEQLDVESLAQHVDLTQFQLGKDYNIRPASSVLDQLQRTKKYFVKVKTEISKERKRDAKAERKTNAALDNIVNQTVANNEALERK